MGLELRSTLTPDAALLYCSGQFAAETQTNNLREQVNALLRERRKLVVDLGRLDYIDNAGLSILVGLYSAARSAGGEIRYQNLSVSVSFRKLHASESFAA